MWASTQNNRAISTWQIQGTKAIFLSSFKLQLNHLRSGTHSTKKSSSQELLSFSNVLLPEIRHRKSPGNSTERNYLTMIGMLIPMCCLRGYLKWVFTSSKPHNLARLPFRLHVGQYVTVNGDVVSHLNISSIHTNDGGLYKCIAWSKVGHTEHSNKLNVYGKPFVRPMEKKAIVAGEMLIVTCPVAGYPIDSIVWERGEYSFSRGLERSLPDLWSSTHNRQHIPDGRVLPINRKQKVFHNGTLIIENVERQSDQATYTCVAKNPQGLTSRGSLEVQVMGRCRKIHFSFIHVGKMSKYKTQFNRDCTTMHFYRSQRVRGMMEGGEKPIKRN